ncbi:MAG: PilZ domain-containing protein, partial [Anaeromyxobacteraceae bacterium]|nr:PilZ domain-containing protein [Anaeromyxobacteraceae bacterium]
MLRVDYPVGDRTTFSYASNLSATGVHLRGATRLEVGQRVPLALHLRTAPKPVALEATVRRVQDGGAPGAGLEFVRGQEDAVAAVRHFLEEEVVRKLEASLARSLSNAANVALVAAHRVESGRPEEAVDLYWRALQEQPEALPLYEGLARLLVAGAREEEDEAAPRLGELEALLEGGLAVGETPALRAIREEVVELRKAVTRKARERAAREAEERRREEQAREEKLRAALTREAQAQADKLLAARRRELEKELAARQEAADAAAAEARRAVQGERAALTTLAAELQAREAKLAKAAQRLDQRLAQAEEARQADA